MNIANIIAIPVQTAGVGLGEMDAKLIQKIEELTLYIIGQEKRMSELEKKNENQAKEIQELKTKLN
jgi:hypothetical protein